MSASSGQIQGALQQRVMRALWDLGEGSVEQVRQTLPAKHRGAYTTIQTVLNRLAERGLVARERESNVIRYSPAVSESDYYSRSLAETLSSASDEARRAALAQVVGELGPGEFDQVRSLAREVAKRRRTGRR
jgi:predicted transcriptional regulator